MPLTLIDLLHIPVMQQANVRTASSSLTSRSIETISVIELPVEDFIRKNELVLTTAIGCNDSGTLKEFVQDIIESEAVALAIATGRYIKVIPEEILQLAEQHHFPIIEIPWEIRFADITEAVLTEVHNWRQTKFQQFEELQKQLLHLFINGSPLSDAAAFIYQDSGIPIVIVNHEGVVKGKSKNSEHLVQPDLSDPSIIQYKIQSADRLFGYLLMSLDHETTNHTSNEKINMMSNIIATLTLWFQREHAVQEVEMRLRDDFVWSLAKGEIDSWDTVFSRAKSMGYNLALPYVCMIGAIENAEKLYENREKKTLETSYEQWLYSLINSVEEQISLAGNFLKRATMKTYQQERFIIFFEVSNLQVEHYVKQFLDCIESKLTQAVPGLVLSWGIGENHAGVKTFHESFIDARNALDIGSRQKGPGHRSTYSSTSFYRALLTLANNSEIQEITYLTIGSLIKYEEQRGLNLITTLKAYIQNQGNVSQTARALNLHRHTLLYRLKKIETLTNRSLVDTDDLFLLDLSLRLWSASIAR
ncbi:purine catabolism regulatory protein [Brevibacillus reuszeri]|uniref:Purine catabolism regulatory protein n=1 Tax=Brevibacillus reuszeri TaxID=54915 RepID=A0A0K9YL92_9BACL|nr:PucR family transcriptional regulator [Brevibacillus reuszeri]KNB69459.1 hypothetical protein ADS79_26620 [Brevibacillus reuszeri]MED1861562.1 PucR family transcriptional regulator ligand-binding domain-containing protein [Brevibacillus reuszeri]GED70902.1 purine catabolism regulatory protein [Brevibacillus reuszeri]